MVGPGLLGDVAGTAAGALPDGAAAAGAAFGSFAAAGASSAAAAAGAAFGSFAAAGASSAAARLEEGGGMTGASRMAGGGANVPRSLLRKATQRVKVCNGSILWPD